MRDFYDAVEVLGYLTERGKVDWVVQGRPPG